MTSTCRRVVLRLPAGEERVDGVAVLAPTAREELGDLVLGVLHDLEARVEDARVHIQLGGLKITRHLNF